MNHAVRNCSSSELGRLEIVRRGLLFALVWAAAAVVPLAARAADEPPVKPAQPTPVLVHNASALIDAAPADAGKTPPATSATWEKLIYVPYRALKSVLQDPKAAAIVPLDEYLRWLQSNRGQAARLPIAAVLTEAHYNAKVDKDVVRIHGVLTIQSLEKHWSGATVAFGEAAIGKITSEKDRVLVRGLGRGLYALLVPDEGTYRVELELTTAVRTSPEGRSFDFDCPTVGISTFDLTVAEPDQAIELVPRPVIESADSPQGQTRIKANLASTPHLVARWHSRTSTRPDSELLMAVDNVLAVMIGDGVIHSDATLTYKILKGETNRLKLAVPVDDRILDVSSPQGGVRAWKAAKEANRQLVTVDLLSAVSKEVIVEVHTERPLPADGFDVAGVDDQGKVLGIHAVDVLHESGRLIVDHREGTDVSTLSEKGVVQIEATDVPQASRGPNALFYKFYSPAFRLRVEARAVEPQIVCTQRAQFVLREDELRMSSLLNYEVTRTGIFELDLKVPDGLSIDAVESPALRTYRVDAASHKLIVSLNEKQQGSIALTVTGHREMPAAGDVDLPLLEPLGTFREMGLIGAFAPEGIELVADDSKLAGAHPEPPGSLTPPTDTRPAGSWSYRHRPVTIHVRAVRKPTRLTARVETTINARQDSATLTARVIFQVENAAVDTFRIAVPQAAADRVQIQSENGEAGVKQQIRDEKAADGFVGFTITLQKKVAGSQPFLVKYDLKPSAASDAAAKTGEHAAAAKAEFVAPLPQAQGLKNADNTDRVPLARVDGEVSVTKDASLSAAATATGGDVEPIDVRELTHLDHNGYLAFRYERQPVEVRLSLVKYGVQPVMETVVSRALFEVVIARDATALYRCRYLLKSSQRQRLALELPADAQPLGVFLDGRTLSLETDPAAPHSDQWKSFFVNVVRPTSSDEPMHLAVQFRRPISPTPFESLAGGTLALYFPRLGGSDEHVAVQQTRTAIWIPKDFSFVQTPIGFLPESQTLQVLGRFDLTSIGPTPSDLDTWIGGSRGALFEFPLEGDSHVYNRVGPAESIQLTWARMPLATIVVSLAIVIMGWLLRRCRWETLATLVLIAVLAAALGALVDRELVWHAILAARFGLMALAAIWIIEAFRRASIRRPVTPTSTPTSTPPAAAPAVGGGNV
jgi:hypothetical protein